MKPKKQNSNAKVCIGAGLIALDVVITAGQSVTRFYAGGSCGNVLTILSFLGWDSYPIARLSNNVAADLIVEDFTTWNVKDKLITFTKDGSTPIIIHRILRDINGIPKHKFEFRNPEDGSYLPSYKPCLAKSVSGIVENSPLTDVFYFDRICRSSVDLAKEYKSNGATIFFEPSSLKDSKGFQECLQICDIVKFSDERIPNFSEIYPIAIAPLEIQTLGNRGLQYRKLGQSKWTFVSGYSIDNVIDSAGAGDWCTSGIIFSLFNQPRSLASITKIELNEAFKFGQALGALNCTYESARGLMYNIDRHDLLLLINHIVTSEMHHINSKSKAAEIVNPKRNLPIKISSLFAHH